MVRHVPLVLAALLALTPFAMANQAPVAVVSAQSEAVLGEPVVFTDASFDADGTVAAREWEFSDGRSRSGTPVTYRFDYPGIHTVTLRVWDNQGAQASTEFHLTVHAPLMQGRAVALRSGDSTYADTGDVATAQHENHVDAVGAANYGQLRVAGLDASVRTLDNRALALATVDSLYIPNPAGYILITGIEAEAVVGCDFPTILSAKFTQVRLNDAPIVPPGTVAPNTVIDLPGGGTLLLNAQGSPAPDRLGVTAVRVVLPGQPMIEIARAEAGARFCPY